MNDVLTRLAPAAEEALPALCRRFGVRRLDLFGSAADGRFDPERSDLDFLVAFDSQAGGSLFDRYFDVLEALEALFGRKIDLVTKSPSEMKNPYFRRQVEAQRTNVYADDE